MRPATDHFPADADGLEHCRRPERVELADGDTFELRIAPVAKQLGSRTVRMLAYNGSVPGPTLEVREGSEVVVEVENQGDLPATVHWHGLRLENRYDGTHETQRPLEVGDRFRYRLQFPDPGVYWYHPHVRQDYGQELGLYGNILVVPSEPDYWPPAHRELLITLDDILIEGGQVAPFSRKHTTHSAMGRFGNQMLIDGEPELALTADAGEVVRFYLTNTANTRVFQLAIRGGRMKLVGGDSGRVEHEELIESVVLAPSERVVVDVLFESSGEAVLEHRTPGRTYTLATISVGQGTLDSRPTEAFGVLRTNAELVAERRRSASDRDREPDKTIAFVAEMDFDEPEGAVVFQCPMHPEVVSPHAASCPTCGMKLMPVSAGTAIAEDGHDDHHGHASYATDDRTTGEGHAHAAHAAGHSHEAVAAGGIEWEDDMVEVNRTTTPSNTRWKIVDRTSGSEGRAIEWRFTAGDRVKIRLVNEMVSDHPMHHPFHIHGAGRFLILSRDGVEDPNLVWSDTVLVRTGEVVDILLDVTHPGRWMAHCHIAEHHESGMMFSFDVDPAS